MAKLARFYGWTLEYIERMNYSDYSKMAKAMVMLEAREGLGQIELNNFSDFDQKTRESIQRRLKQLVDVHIKREVLDYKEVVANLARKLMRG